jgi:NADH-ubiquinone oxidoreductase chain 4
LVSQLLYLLIFIPLVGIFFIAIYGQGKGFLPVTRIKLIGLVTSIINLIISLVIFILFDFSSKQFQFIQEHHQISSFDIYLGIDGLSIYFVLLTTIIMPLALLSN